jgi:hypothetical protein
MDRSENAMNLKASALFLVLLAVVCIGQQVAAQKAASANAAPAFVPMPDDIHCSFHNLNFVMSFGKNGTMVTNVNSVEQVTCQITGNSPGTEKEVPLTSTKVVNGMLPTKSFGDMKLKTESISSGVTVSIRHDKLQSFRAFLQK